MNYVLIIQSDERCSARRTVIPGEYGTIRVVRSDLQNFLYEYDCEACYDLIVTEEFDFTELPAKEQAWVKKTMKDWCPKPVRIDRA